MILNNDSNNIIEKVFLEDWSNSYRDNNSKLAKRISDEYSRTFTFANNKQRGFTTINNLESDNNQLFEYNIPEFDIVIVDLYPFEETVKKGGTQDEIIEKIDIGGIALIRAAAKNHKNVVCISSVNDYESFLEIYKNNNGQLSLDERKYFARNSFLTSSKYDSAIFNYFDGVENLSLRYGENPHQSGIFSGKLDDVFTKLSGKDLSYNNLLDIDSAMDLMSEFKGDKPTFAILKHNNACGIAMRNNIKEAYDAALEADPVSAFGGILISNSKIDSDTASAINSLFCEVVISPEFERSALEILIKKKNFLHLLENLILLKDMICLVNQF